MTNQNCEFPESSYCFVHNSFIHCKDGKNCDRLHRCAVCRGQHPLVSNQCNDPSTPHWIKNNSRK